MREIKFRVWFKPDQKMYDIRGMTFDASTGDVYGVHFPVVYLAVRDDIELMQYTGLKDKNGKEIYEGDIVKYGKLALNDVWGMYEIKEDIPSLFELYDAITEKPEVTLVEVVGNIYENPELLEILARITDREIDDEEAIKQLGG